MVDIGTTHRSGNKIGKVIGIVDGLDQFNMPTYCYKIHYTEYITDRYNMKTRKINIIQNCNKSAVERG